MSTRTTLKTKYTQIHLNEDLESGEPYFYATVDFEWGDKADPIAVMFSMNMDKILERKVREELAPHLEIDPQKDIYLEDVWLMINGYDESNKHHLSRLLKIVNQVEAQFDEML